MVYNPDLMFQENEVLRTENSALRSKVNSQNTCAVCGNDSPSSTVSDQVHIVVPGTCNSTVCPVLIPPTLHCLGLRTHLEVVVPSEVSW